MVKDSLIHPTSPFGLIDTMTATNNRIKLVVAEGHTLGYIHPDFPRYLLILHASILKGSRYSNHSGFVMLSKNHRLATLQDFEDFRVAPHGFIGNTEEYEYDTSLDKPLTPLDCNLMLNGTCDC